jgi:hypothetical protein
MSFAASQSFPLEELARNQAATFQQQRKALILSRPLARFVIPIAGVIAERWVLHYAQKFAQQVVWFRGATESVENEPLDCEIDARDALRQSLDSMESELLEISEGSAGRAEALRKWDGNARGRVRDALDRLSRVASELRQEVRNFKGAVQAHDANVAALSRARKPARTVEQLQADLEHAIH